MLRIKFLIKMRIKKIIFLFLFLAIYFSCSIVFAVEEEDLIITHLPIWDLLKRFDFVDNKIINFKTINPEATFHSILVSIFLIVSSFFVKKRINKEKLPDDSLNLINIIEVIVEQVLNLIKRNIGERGIRFLPLFGTLTLFILFSNLMGLIPGFLPPTDNINITAGCAIIVFFTTHIFGILENRLNYIKHFAGPKWWLTPIMLPIEIIGHLARPLSLSLRLFGNITGDHLVLVIFTSLVPLVVPVFALFLGVFVSIIQSLIFLLLSIMYISSAIEHQEH